MRVKDRSEIDRTLGKDRKCNGLPFVLEMELLFGTVFQVYRRIDKIDDMQHKTGLRL